MAVYFIYWVQTSYVHVLSISFRLKNSKLHENRCHRKNPQYFVFYLQILLRRALYLAQMMRMLQPFRTKKMMLKLQPVRAKKMIFSLQPIRVKFRWPQISHCLFFKTTCHCLSHQTSLCDFIVDFLPRHRWWSGPNLEENVPPRRWRTITSCFSPLPQRHAHHVCFSSRYVVI